MLSTPGKSVREGEEGGVGGSPGRAIHTIGTALDCEFGLQVMARSAWFERTTTNGDEPRDSKTRESDETRMEGGFGCPAAGCVCGLTFFVIALAPLPGSFSRQMLFSPLLVDFTDSGMRFLRPLAARSSLHQAEEAGTQVR